MDSRICPSSPDDGHGFSTEFGHRRFEDSLNRPFTRL
ncbi:MAG: hypothetical protein QOH22_1097, partial [Gemmatimonadaceae bacterium]|nr:hypothetical protein [Gemmatimonadaceae bacterium]